MTPVGRIGSKGMWLKRIVALAALVAGRGRRRDARREPSRPRRRRSPPPRRASPKPKAHRTKAKRPVGEVSGAEGAADADPDPHVPRDLQAPAGVPNAELWVDEDSSPTRCARCARRATPGSRSSRRGTAGSTAARCPSTRSSSPSTTATSRTTPTPSRSCSKLGWPGVLYLEIKSIGPGGLTEHQIRSLMHAGWEIDSHTLTHPDLTTLDDAALRHELRDSRRELQQRFGVQGGLLRLPGGPLRRPRRGGHEGRGLHGGGDRRRGDRARARRPVRAQARAGQRLRHRGHAAGEVARLRISTRIAASASLRFSIAAGAVPIRSL